MTTKTKTPLAVPYPLEVVLRPFRAFLRTESSSGVLLLAATVVAFIWANSSLAASYQRLLSRTITIEVFGHGISWALGHWINDGLMTVFFFVVGMEIKRELVVGQLSGFRRAVLPAVAAAGGMLVPALIFVAFAWGTPGMKGWGIPVATDIAFALGCLALLEGRVPPSLGVFLTALAIFDDLGAILVIALFYGHGIDWLGLAAAAAITSALVAANLFGVRRHWPYIVLGALLWVAMIRSGIHATLAGVILGLCIPARPRRSPAQLDELMAGLTSARDAADEASGEQALATVDAYLREARAPLDGLLHALHPWVAFLVVPIFALANAGVDLRGATLGEMVTPLSSGVALGLFLGKQAGIFAATYVAVRFGLSPMPAQASWRQLYGVAVLGGIGFTMSLFVGALAFGPQPALETQAKVGILAGSLASALAGLLVLVTARRRPAAV